MLALGSRELIMLTFSGGIRASGGSGAELHTPPEGQLSAAALHFVRPRGVALTVE